MVQHTVPSSIYVYMYSWLDYYFAPAMSECRCSSAKLSNTYIPRHSCVVLVMRAVRRPNMAPTAIPPQLTVKKASTANPYCPPGISGISQNVTIVLYRTIVTASVFQFYT